MELGFALSSEDHPPNELVRQAALAERAGFTFALISDHLPPVGRREQGHSPFVWSTLGGIAQATETIRVGTGVTCPMIRHPPGDRRAGRRDRRRDDRRAASSSASAPARTSTSTCSAQRWPLARRAARDARGGGRRHAPALAGRASRRTAASTTPSTTRGSTRCPTRRRVYVAAAQPQAAELAGRIGDGLISTAPDESSSRPSTAAEGKPKLGMMHCAYDTDAESGR